MITDIKEKVKALRTYSQNSTIIVSFVNWNHILIALNWAQFIKRLGITNYVVISLDRISHFFMRVHRVNSYQWLCPYATIKEFWSKRLHFLTAMVKSDVNVIHSDLDAIWLKNPIPDYVENSDFDITASINHCKTAFPYDIRKKMGFIICMGWIFYKSTPNTKEFLNNLLDSSPPGEFFDDQELFNTFVLKNNTGISKVCGGTRIVELQRLRMKVLGPSIMRRGTRANDDDDAYVYHPLTGPFFLTKIKNLYKYKLWCYLVKNV